MIQLDEVVKTYREACRSIAKRIKNSRYKSRWFQEGVGLGASPSAYYRRLKSGDWTPEQLEKFAYLLDGKEVPMHLRLS